MSDKRDCWTIFSREIVRSKVYFEEEVTKEEAIQLFMESEFDDIMDTDTVDTEEAWIEDDKG